MRWKKQLHSLTESVLFTTLNTQPPFQVHFDKRIECLYSPFHLVIEQSEPDATATKNAGTAIAGSLKDSSMPPVRFHIDK
ncbi:hypothetical protein L4X63_13280 [Geomonas sp. Red32]|uniref:hypothetical protein n=1 Tax=Geomonas sp. Red32 TaxID=2912856 RepID=UPI00202CBFF5|nr:hypothetical protein [Geomonas sp. Red32]MCM0082566.1 hypothetical protein [Geomonas sp. Red32]